MEKEKKYFAGWWLWIVILLFSTTILFTGLSYFGIITKIIIKRKVFENSYQKYEADKTAKTIYTAQLAQLKAKLNNPNLDSNTKNEIQAQIDAIKILKASKED